METIAEIEKKYISKTRAHIIKTFLQWGCILENMSQVDNILSGKAFCLPIPLVTWHTVDLRMLRLVELQLTDPVHHC